MLYFFALLLAWLTIGYFKSKQAIEFFDDLKKQGTYYEFHNYVFDMSEVKMKTQHAFNRAMFRNIFHSVVRCMGVVHGPLYPIYHGWLVDLRTEYETYAKEQRAKLDQLN